MSLIKDLKFIVGSYLDIEDTLKLFDNKTERDKLINLYHEIPSIRDTCVKGSLIIFEYLYEIMNFNNDDFSQSNLCTLCDGRCNLDVIKYLVSKGITFYNDALNIAIMYDQLDLMKYFIELGIEFGNEFGLYYPWLYILEYKSWSVANFLINRFQLPNFNHLNHFLYKIINPDYNKTNALEIVKYLLDNNLISLEFDNFEDIIERKYVLKLRFEYQSVYEYMISRTLY